MLLNQSSVRSTNRSLFQQLRNSFKGFNQQRWHTSNEIFPEKQHSYGYEKAQKHSTKTTRQWYEAPVGSATKKRFQTIDFRQYQTDLEEAAQKTLDNQSLEKLVESEIVEKDEVFGDIVPKRVYDRVLQKELYFHRRSSEHFVEEANRKIAFLEKFNASFEKVPELTETLAKISDLATASENGAPLKRAAIDQQFLIEDDFYASNEECKELFEKIKVVVPNMHYKVLPDLALALSLKLRYNKDVFGVWRAIEESFLKSIHHYTVMELVRMRHAATALSPKSLSRNTLQAIQNIVFTELHNIPTLSDLAHTLFAYRNINSHKLYTQMLDEITKRPARTLQDAIAVLFVFSHSLFPNYKRKDFREKDQDKKEKFRILDHIGETLAENAKAIEGDDVVRVLISLNNLQADTFKDVLVTLERYVIKNIDTLDSFQTAQIIYGFSKAILNKGFGSAELYKALQKSSEKHWKEFSNIDKARAFYAFTAQDLIDPVFRKKFVQPWLLENLEHNLNHSELHCVSFALLYEQNKDAELWKKFVRNVSCSEYVVPVINYYPLKLARYYLQNLFPKWNFDLYKLACNESEASWNAGRQIDVMMENKEWTIIGDFLQNRLEFKSIGLDNFENLFLIDWAIMPQRVAIMVQGERDTLPSGKPTPMYQLKVNILESKKFGVVKLNFKQFEDVPVDQKVAYLKTLIEAAIAKQETYIKDIEEPKEWLKFMDKMQELTYRHVLLGEATKGGFIEPDEFEVKFDWSKLQKEFNERDHDFVGTRKLPAN